MIGRQEHIQHTHYNMTTVIIIIANSLLNHWNTLSSRCSCFVSKLQTICFLIESFGHEWYSDQTSYKIDYLMRYSFTFYYYLFQSFRDHSQNRNPKTTWSDPTFKNWTSAYHFSKNRMLVHFSVTLPLFTCFKAFRTSLFEIL